MIRYKLIALDADDTFLTDDRRITQRTKDAVAKAMAAGIKVVIATGRAYGACKPFIDELNLTEPAIINGGAHIRDYETGKLIYRDEIDNVYVSELIKWADSAGYHAHIYDNDRIAYAKDNEWAKRYEEYSGLSGAVRPEMVNLDELPPTPKVVVVAAEETIDMLLPQMREKYGNVLEVLRSRSTLMEFSRLGGGKGKALKYLAEQYYGFKREEVMAIGDSEIDISMIEYAGLGIAVANGMQTAKDVADVICPSNEEDGVAQSIEKYALGEE
ncbi:MAG: Cof-type HAD-IIB family hydrolase [Christensenellales bacterium]|jgi:Cof subfamily protein (haloacid dehalogenase superfamily)